MEFQHSSDALTGETTEGIESGASGATGESVVQHTCGQATGVESGSVSGCADAAAQASDSEESIAEDELVSGDASSPDVALAGAAEGKAAVEDAPRPAGRLSMVSARVSPEKLRRAWKTGSVGKTALVAAMVYMAVAGAFYFLAFRPVGSRFERLSQELEVLHDYMVIDQANAALSIFSDGLMRGDQRLTVMSEFSLMAEESGVRIVGDPELLLPREVSKLVIEYPVRLRLRGTYHEIGTFLSLLEGSPRFVQVEEVEVLSDVASRDRGSEASVLLAIASWEE
jgi:hypothetical protein